MLWSPSSFEVEGKQGVHGTFHQFQQRLLRSMSAASTAPRVKMSGPHYQVTHDLSQAQGNPWFICTLWLAQYRIAHASTIDELHSALPLLQWAQSHTLASGVMAEQVNPFTSDPLSVSPLTWSLAEYVLAVRWYLGKCRRFNGK